MYNERIKEIKTFFEAEQQIPLRSNNERWQIIGSIITQVKTKKLYTEHGLKIHALVQSAGTNWWGMISV